MKLIKNLFKKKQDEGVKSNLSLEDIFAELEKILKKASIAQISGFRPPEDPLTSWFGGRGVMLSSESIPQYSGNPMFPLLQVNLTELPYLPPKLTNTKILVVWFNQKEIPFDKKNGDGWLIREYSSFDNLKVVENVEKPTNLKSFPIKWNLLEKERPGWDEAGGLIDMSAINENEEASDKFFDEYQNHPFTKIGGYPTEIQHGIGGDSTFVFQIGSEEKPNWMWADNGIGYFLKTQSGEWEFQCQFY